MCTSSPTEFVLWKISEKGILLGKGALVNRSIFNLFHVLLKLNFSGEKWNSRWKCKHKVELVQKLVCVCVWGGGLEVVSVFVCVYKCDCVYVCVFMFVSSSVFTSVLLLEVFAAGIWCLKLAVFCLLYICNEQRQCSCFRGSWRLLQPRLMAFPKWAWV